MQPLTPELVLSQLNQWKGMKVYIHIEVNPGAYWRNGCGTLCAAHVKDVGPYRLFLELDEGIGLIQIDALTHMKVDENLVVCTAYDELHRLARTILISTSAFES